MPPAAIDSTLLDGKELLLSEAFGETLTDLASTVGELLEASSTVNTNRTALVCLHQPATLFQELTGEDDVEHNSSAYIRWSYAQLRFLADKLATSLSARGIEAGAPIATLLPNGAQRIILQWTAARLSCPLVPLDVRFMSSSSQGEHMLRLAQPKALVVWDSQTALDLDRHMPEMMMQLPLKILALSGRVPGWQNFQDMFSESHRVNIRSQTTEPDETALVIFTSGTTDFPKGCVHTHRNLIAAAEANRKVSRMDWKSVLCGHNSLSQIAGNNYALTCWALGGTVVLPAESFEPASALRAIGIEKCTHMRVTPNFMHRLLEHPSMATTDLRSMDSVCLSGDLIAPAHIARCRTGFNPNRVTTRFGMSEGTPTISMRHCGTSVSCEDDTVAAGYVVPGARLRVCAPGSKSPLPRGTAGELHQGGAQVIEHYIDGTAQVFYTDSFGSWLVTGDRAVMASDGKIWVLGRYKDIIIRDGLNLSPTVIQSILDKDPGISVSRVIP